jgi:hypothetical protein
MSHVPTILHAPDVHAEAPRAKTVYGMLSAVIAAALIASLLTAMVLSRSQAAAEAHHATVAPATPVTTAASPGTGVPEARTVFDGKDMPVEEPAATF